MTWGCISCHGTNPEGTRFCGHCGTPHDRVETDGNKDERRLITALFADISGFTSLADRLDTDHLHQVISPVISVLAGVAEDYGGTLAKYAGDAVLVFFGAPVAQEDHATRALWCATEMHRALADAIPRLPADAHGLELHIGVNSGTVVAGMFGGDIGADYSILGDSVNVAQRLESVASGGETYVGETTWQLTNTQFELDALGDLTLKGKSKPVKAWRLIAPAESGSSSSRTAQVASVLVGRGAELRTVQKVLDAGSGIVSLTAEPGGGKTRLSEEIRVLAEAAGYRWLDGRCVSYGTSLAYWPYIDVLRRTYGIRIEQDPTIAAAELADRLSAAGVREVAAYFARLLGLPPPSGVPDISALEGEAFVRALHDAFISWVTALTVVEPVILAIEDIHWSDAASIDLSSAVAQFTADLPIILCLTGRPEALDTLVRLSELASPDRRAVIPLGPLDRFSTASVAEQVLGRPPGEQFLDMVLERSGGNPFFIRELVRSLRDSGALEPHDGRWELRPDWDVSGLPPTIEGVLSARIDRLPRSAAHLLQVASVIGRRVNVALLEGIAEDVVGLPRTLDRLVTAGFLDRLNLDGQTVLNFHHALVVDAAYSRLMERERRDLHRRVAETGEVIYGSGDDVIDLLARHFYLAGAGVKAVQYLEQAAERSKRLFANEEAVLHIRRALELAQATERIASRIPVLNLALAELEDVVGRYDEATLLYQTVRQTTGDIDAWRGLASLARRRGDPQGALSLLDEAFHNEQLNGADLSPLWLERAMALIVEGSFLEAIEAAEAGLAVAGADITPVVGNLLLQETQAELFLRRVSDALEHAMRAREVMDRCGDPRRLAIALRVLGVAQIEAGDYGEGAAALRRGLELAERTGTVDEIVSCLINLGLGELRSGDLDAAIEHDRRALELTERVGLTVGQTIASVNLADTLLQRGDLDEAECVCRRGLSMAGEVGQSWALADATRIMATIRLRLGFAEDAMGWAEKAAASFVEMGDPSSATEALHVAAEAAAHAGDEQRARSLMARARSTSPTASPRSD